MICLDQGLSESPYDWDECFPQLPACRQCTRFVALPLAGDKQVFWDRKDIDPGQDFAEVIEKQIKSSRALIALVRNDWLSATDKEGHRRIDSPEDWIRRETVLELREEILDSGPRQRDEGTQVHHNIVGW